MGIPNSADIVVLRDPEALAYEAAKRFIALSQAGIRRQGSASVALAGGNTPQRMHQYLAEAPFREQLDWTKLHIFFSDERFLPPDDSESNVFMAQQTLLSRVPLPVANIHPFPTVGVSPEEAADQYAAMLVSHLGDPPTLDLVFLGMGEDGHTASLFPHHLEVTTPSAAWVAAVPGAPKPPPIRLTLTYRTLQHARHLIVLVSGSAKAATLRAVFQEEINPAALPIQGIYPANGQTTWLVDKEAAACLMGGENGTGR
jgi:6-phosphogluconolactonase